MSPPDDPSAVATASEAQSSRGELVIPQTHPRIWWTQERLAQARRWYARHPFEPGNKDAWGHGLRYVLTKDNRSAAAAIRLLMNFTIPEERLRQVSSDQYRWNDWFPVIFDWTYNAMTSEQRQTLISRYNHYVDVIRQKRWGGPGMEGNNYYWGYFRNELNWAIATYHENSSMAPTFLHHALATRWQKSFLPYAASAGKGGVPPEGSQYGRYMLGYPVVPLTTAKLLGRDLYQETSFFKEAVFYMIYATTPAATTRKGVSKPPYYQVFPFWDDEFDGGYPSALSAEYGDFMTAAAMEWKTQPLGKYARHWLNQVRPKISPHVAAVDPGGPQEDFRDLPLDYYAPGSQYFYARNRWGPQASSLFFQLSRSKNASHDHLDSGTFQIWRKGRWLSKESTGYSMKFNGANARQTVSHNGILFGGIGLANAYSDGTAKVLRLESSADYAYAAVDLTPAYRAHRSEHRDRDDNPHAGHAVREFLFIRPLETLVILDRLESTSEKNAAKDVVKTFVLHFPERPQIKGTGSVLGVNGDQVLQVTTLLPKQPDYQVVDEGDFKGRHQEPSFYQYRLQVNDQGRQQSYFLHVLQARDATQATVDAQLEEDSGSWTVRLAHPTLGHALVVLKKGMASKGGAVGYSAQGMPSATRPLLEGVQGIEMSENGPRWHERSRAEARGVR